MKLFTKSIEDRLVKNYEIAKQGDEKKEEKLKVVVKLFNPTGIGTWYLTYMNTESNVAWGLAHLHEKEQGFINVAELKEFKGRFGLGIERDRMFESNKKTLKECEAL